jgi:hypothetical protein
VPRKPRKSSQSTTPPPDVTSAKEKARAVVWAAFGNTGPPSPETVSPSYALQILRHRHDDLGDVAAPSQALWIAGELSLELPAWALEHFHRAFGELARRSRRIRKAGEKKKRASSALGRELTAAYGYTTGQRGHASTLRKGDALERDQRLANEVALRMLPKAKATTGEDPDATDVDRVPGYWLRIGEAQITGGEGRTAAIKSTAARHGVSERTVRRAWTAFLAWRHADELSESGDRSVVHSTACLLCRRQEIGDSLP